jgi:glutamate synthase (NADPH/NADH) small chain
MDFLAAQNRITAGQMFITGNQIIAEGKNVLVIGGGDTGSDCVGTAVRQKATSVTQIEILPEPPLTRAPDNPWPFYGKILKTYASHEEGCERLWSLSTIKFTGSDNHIKNVEAAYVEWEYIDGNYSMRSLPGTNRVIDADLVLLALGFVHPVLDGLLSELGLELDNRKNVKVDINQSTSRTKVFAAGDVISGTSLVVNAIASGRSAAKNIDRFLRTA